MSYSKCIAIFNIVFGFLYVGFAIYFVLCSFALRVDAESWEHFVFGVAVVIDFLFGAVNIIDGVKILIKIEEKK